jgi:hypothetical protein
MADLWAFLPIPDSCGKDFRAGAASVNCCFFQQSYKKKYIELKMEIKWFCKGEKILSSVLFLRKAIVLNRI